MNVKDVENYISSRIGEMEFVGDLTIENGFYYFNVEIPKDKEINFENSIFEVVCIDNSFSTYAKLKIEESFLNHCLRFNK
jgi:hypothetical protein